MDVYRKTNVVINKIKSLKFQSNFYGNYRQRVYFHQLTFHLNYHYSMNFIYLSINVIISLLVFLWLWLMFYNLIAIW